MLLLHHALMEFVLLIGLMKLRLVRPTTAFEIHFVLLLTHLLHRVGLTVELVLLSFETALSMRFERLLRFIARLNLGGVRRELLLLHRHARSCYFGLRFHLLLLRVKRRIARVKLQLASLCLRIHHVGLRANHRGLRFRIRRRRLRIRIQELIRIRKADAANAHAANR